MTTTTTPTPSAEVLRNRMVDHILEAGRVRSQSVVSAMRAVPRHEFVPAASLADAYANQPVITKRAPDGTSLSCATVPTVVATMLDQLDVRPGNNVFEVGAGTGYNAALLRHLTGPKGMVTTLDVDGEVTAQARRALIATGNGDVEVITRDGQLGAPEHEPYDRITVQVGAWDIPPSWRQQLSLGGRLVLPLRWRGQCRSVALVRENDRLVSDSVELCGFVPMIGQEGERTDPIATDAQVTLTWDADQAIDATALNGVLDTPKKTVWSGVFVRLDEPFDGVWLRMTAFEPGTCRIAAEPAAVESDLCTPGFPGRNPALVENDSLAYLLFRRVSGPGSVRLAELGAIGHGPVGEHLAERICNYANAWGRNRTTQPAITIYPAGAPEGKNTDPFVVEKPHSRMTFTW